MPHAKLSLGTATTQIGYSMIFNVVEQHVALVSCTALTSVLENKSLFIKCVPMASV